MPTREFTAKYEKTFTDGFPASQGDRDEMVGLVTRTYTFQVAAVVPSGLLAKTDPVRLYDRLVTQVEALGVNADSSAPGDLREMAVSVGSALASDLSGFGVTDMSIEVRADDAVGVRYSLP